MRQTRNQLSGLDRARARRAIPVPHTTAYVQFDSVTTCILAGVGLPHVDTNYVDVYTADW